MVAKQSPVINRIVAAAQEKKQVKAVAQATTPNPAVLAVKTANAGRPILLRNPLLHLSRIARLKEI
jgi:hypothetical protein